MKSESKIKKLMREELPNLSFQKRLMYRTDTQEVIQLFKILNKEIFDNKLILPEIHVQPRCRKYWGICIAENWNPIYNPKKSNCKILLNDKWYCKQWLITTLAHEMCHQYQWDILAHKRIKQGKDPIMSHGPSFFIHRKKLKKFGIALKREHSIKNWFRTQNMFKT